MCYVLWYVMKQGPPVRSILPRVIKNGFKELNMINYFTCGPDEASQSTH